MKNEKSKQAVEKIHPADIIMCPRCGTRFTSIEGLRIEPGMLEQRARCPVCRNEVHSVRQFTVKHGTAFAVGVGIVLAGSGIKPASFGDGYALYSPAAKRGGEQANGRRE